MTTSNFHPVAETDPGYGQLFAVLMRRRFWLLGVFCGVLSIAAVLTLLAKPTYQSSMQLLIEPNYQGKKDASGESSGSESQFADSNVELDNATQLSLMKSSQLIQKAVPLLRSQYPDIKAEDIQKSLELTQVVADKGNEKVSTKIFKAVYTDTDAVKTQRVLKAIQKVYQDYNLEQQELRLSKGLAFINKQLPQVRAKVNQAESALEKFRRSQDVIDPEVQGKGAIEALNAVAQDQRTNLAQLQELQARYATLQQQLARSPQAALVASRLSQSTRYQTLLNEIQKTELDLAQARVRFRDNTPFVQQLLEQRQRQIALLQQEVGRVLRGNANQVDANGEQLLRQGQLGETDLKLTTDLVEAQANLRALSAKAQSLTQSEQQLRRELKRYPTLLAEYNRLQPEVEVNRVTLEQLLKARQELGLEIARGGFDWQVVEQPQPGVKIGPDLKRNLLLGAVAGLMLGTVAAFGREGIDDAVHTSDDLTKQVALPLLGMIPEVPQAEITQPLHLPFRKPQALPPVTIRVIQWPPFRESLDLIYKNIQLLNSDFPFKSLVITSALAGEGKSTLALGLAISAARLHQRVLLIDADLRCPSLHKQLNLPNERGLATLLASETTISGPSDIQPSISYNNHNISILTAGPTPSDPAKLLSSRRMGELMAAFEQTYDLVLMDAPPVLGMVDAILAASFCSGVVTVGRIGQVTRTELTQATAMLNKLNVIGVIANGATPSTYGYAAYDRKA